MMPLSLKPTLRFAALLALSLWATASCIRDEEPNAEADIETATLHVSAPEAFFFHASDSVQHISSADTAIRFDVRWGADLSALAPEFTLTAGATIVPASGSTHDFSGEGVFYTVTSQDGAWQRRYRVWFRPIRSDTTPTTTQVHFDFEDFALDATTQKYYIWNEPNGALDADCWATGNPGFRLSKSTAQPDDYPTVPLEQGRTGHGVQLTTRSTLPFGAMVNMRLAAGNLFIGKFDVTNAMRDAMQATQFGKPFTLAPLRFEGWYRYAAGANYQNRNGVVQPDSVDHADIYAVFYRNTAADGTPVSLHGDDVLTHSALVAVARVPQLHETDEWTPFAVDFVYRSEVNDSILAARGYSLAIVASSSRDGASFCGAVGSTLLIDDFSVTCKSQQP